jgi:hypothetical protein
MFESLRRPPGQVGNSGEPASSGRRARCARSSSSVNAVSSTSRSGRGLGLGDPPAAGVDVELAAVGEDHFVDPWASGEQQQREQCSAPVALVREQFGLPVARGVEHVHDHVGLEERPRRLGDLHAPALASCGVLRPAACSRRRRRGSGRAARAPCSLRAARARSLRAPLRATSGVRSFVSRRSAGQTASTWTIGEACPGTVFMSRRCRWPGGRPSSDRLASLRPPEGRLSACLWEAARG